MAPNKNKFETFDMHICESEVSIEANTLSHDVANSKKLYGCLINIILCFDIHYYFP